MNAVDQEFEKQIKSLEKPNLMVVGGTGVGKSSLINLIFGRKVAEVGAGRPVTKGCNLYQSETIPVNIFDTEGYEIEANGNINNSNFKNVVIKEITERKSKNLAEQIHLFWYCLSISSHRITEYDLANIKELSKLGIKLAIVLTKCDQDELDENNQGVHAEKFKKVLKAEGICNPVFQTMTDPSDPLEINDLIDWCLEQLPNDELKNAFVSAQKTNLPAKEKQAAQIIMAAAASASAAAGFNPVPLSDSVILFPIQTGMAAALAKTYGFPALGAVSTSLLKAQIVSMLGKQMASSLLKLIPGVGQIINGAVAGGLTAGLGYGLNMLYKDALVKYLETGKTPDWHKLFENFDFTSFIKNKM